MCRTSAVELWPAKYHPATFCPLRLPLRPLVPRAVLAAQAVAAPTDALRAAMHAMSAEAVAVHALQGVEHRPLVGGEGIVEGGHRLAAALHPLAHLGLAL